MKIQIILIVGLFSAALCSCSKKNGIGADPYAGGKAPLGIAFTGKYPVPASAVAGSKVQFQVKGLKPYEGQFVFLINNEPAKVDSLTDSIVIVTVPDSVSSGLTTIELQGEVFFGPRLTVLGNVTLDPTFGVTTGSNAAINACYYSGQGYLLVGAFTNFNNMAVWNSLINGIALLNTQGSLTTSTLKAGSGANGPLVSVSPLSNGQLIISGNFTTYNKFGGFNNITRINADGSPDTAIVSMINNTTAAINGFDTVSRFNGGTPNVPILRSFVTSDNKVIAVGNFTNYASLLYAKSRRDSWRYNYTNISNVIRMAPDGTLDSTYNFVPSAGNTGANAPVNDACLQKDNKVILIGNFTKYNGVTVNNIVRLDTYGNVDPAFAVGNGANGNINTIQYNATLDKMVITGNFTSFNGVACNGVAILKSDGSLDPSFVFRSVGGGVPNFACILNNGRVIVSGSFNKYDNITRSGFLILDASGSAPQAFNVPGTFQGQIQQVIETTSGLGNPAVVLIGSIQKFDDQPVGNIVRVEILN